MMERSIDCRSRCEVMLAANIETASLCTRARLFSARNLGTIPGERFLCALMTRFKQAAKSTGQI